MNEGRTNKDDNEVEMRTEYDFDYRRAKPNRFASEFRADSIAVVLTPDVTPYFRSSEP